LNFKILLLKQVQKFLDQLPNEYVLNFKTKVDILKENPYSRENNLDIVPLLGMPKNFLDYESETIGFYTKFVEMK